MRNTLAAAAIFVLAVNSAGAEEHRQLGAHVHGHGTLDIALEGNRISLALEAPGADIVGFEHAAASPVEIEQVAKARARLSDPLALFALPQAAGCMALKADVVLEDEDQDGHDHAGAHDHADAHEHADAKGAAGAEHEHHHSAFHADYVLMCKDPSAFTKIHFTYFRTFAGAQSLTVNVIAAKGQSAFEVSRDNPLLDLQGLM